MSKQVKIKKVNSIDILIISDTLDITTDYVCLELHKRNCSYLRVNRDKFQDYSISFDIDNLRLHISIDSKNFIIEDGSLAAIYYRAPIYLHHTPKSKTTFSDQLYKYQWTAFIRNLAIFENARWMNNPISIFRGENKILQLKYAKKIGFNCPSTLLANNIDNQKINPSQKYIVKSIDTVLLRSEEQEAFAYSNVVLGEDIIQSDLSLAPVLVQEYLYPKVDLRVTVVGNRTFAAKIVKNNVGISGDWRKEKDNVDFLKIELPEEIEGKCIEIVNALGLTYGGIDLIEKNNQYYFIEVNPTGEWAWLVKSACLEIDKAICDYLMGLQLVL